MGDCRGRGALRGRTTVRLEALRVLLIEELALRIAGFDVGLGPDEEAKAEWWHSNRAATRTRTDEERQRAVGGNKERLTVEVDLKQRSGQTDSQRE